MPDETKTVTVTQPKDERFRHAHGGVALYGEKKKDALQHEFGGQVVHTTPKPLVHMVCWDADDVCRVEHKGRVVLAGDAKAPLPVEMRHVFANDHKQTLSVKPLDHTLKVSTALAEPIHHALQMRTPLQVRFCNSWNIASRYSVDVRLGKSKLMSIQLTGATVATPQPCPEEPCPPPTAKPGHP